ncbi:cysteine hydrolase [Mucilaginibacter robiniae]|uniref:Cysteine hydrolase n=1 Tax=Mucilaginibacter robiniae TaxID=2728022 RepID=A0A7L5E3D3_9SPHI|nr:isochorismatase family cysteine hydrolase [Mucilaginibacter robiniae]QJD97098.1 cysteine hydrolase [Mucilaginibacter robiniae]
MSTTTTTALLIMDYQVGIADKLPTIDDLAKQANEAAEAARKAGLKVIYTKVGFQEGHPEISVNSMPFFQQVKENNLFTGEQSKLIPQIQVQLGDTVIDKKRFGSFAGSNLQLILQANGITQLVLAGIRTAGVVLSTLRFAADIDYKVTILSNCCADPDPEIHKVLMEKVFPLQAEVVSSKDWAAKL